MSYSYEEVRLFGGVPMDVEGGLQHWVQPLPWSPTRTRNADIPIQRALASYFNLPDPNVDERYFLQKSLQFIWVSVQTAFDQDPTLTGRLANLDEFRNNVERDEERFLNLLKDARRTNSWEEFLGDDIFLKQNQEVFSTPPNPLDSNLVSQYRATFITLANPGVWTEADISYNNVKQWNTLNPEPGFVKEYERMLGKKRAMPINWRCHIHSLEDWMSQEYLFREYCNFTDPEGETGEEDINLMTEVEAVHLMHIALIEPSKWWNRKGHGPTFKQPNASWLFFYPIASPYESDESPERKISVKVGEIPWPFVIIVQDNQNRCYSYRPKNDFAAFSSSVPVFLVEINSFPRSQPSQDCFRMLLQAATVIRFANKFLDEYKTNKNFILVAAYVDDDGIASRYILFQDKESNPDGTEVYYKKKDFDFKQTVDRILFAREMYNFFSALGREGCSQDASGKIHHFQDHIKDYRDVHGLRTLTDLKKGRPPTGQRDNRDSSNHSNGSSRVAGPVQQLGIHGYVVIPDIIEDKGGQMEPLIMPPPHILTVYRSTDATQIKLVAKRLNESIQSIELEVLEYLRTIQPQSSRIISLIEVVPTNAGKYAIFPKRHSVESNLPMWPNDLRLHDKIAQLGWDLIEGLAYLHEHGVAHLDIKPGNLVYTDDFHLQIIDLDSAVRARSENDMVEGVHGTQGWMAPEIGERRVFSPIRADRWSCGQVLLWFLEQSGIEDEGLQRVAKQLMDDNPLHRPSLVNLLEEADVTL
ncbi:hypothetical protein APHAL10511_004016 [Amanita phalloides]|nr:hypothetical protein APHAL10511_004016 [Amanita phalloides]